MLKQLLAYGSTGVLWASLLYRGRMLPRRWHDPAHRAHWLATLSLALSFTVLLPPVYIAIDKALGVPNLARLLANSLALVTAWIFQPFVVRLLNYPATRKSIRRSGWTLLAALGALCILFVLSPVDETETGLFTQRYGTAPYMLEYRLVFLSYLGLMSYELFAASWRCLLGGSGSQLRARVLLQAMGWTFALMYVAHEAAYAVMRATGVRHPLPDPGVVTLSLMGLTVLCLVAGVDLRTPSFASGLRGFGEWWWLYRSHRRLYPLWRDVCEVIPGIAYLPPESVFKDALATRELGLRVRRRAIEIRDGCVKLAPYVDPRVPELARRRCAQVEAGKLQDIDREAIGDAAAIAAGIQAKICGRQTESPTWALSDIFDDMNEEVLYLEKVAEAYKQFRSCSSPYWGRSSWDESAGGSDTSKQCRGA